MIRVLIVSSIRLYREGIRQMLGRCPGLAVVGAKSDGRDLAAEIRDLQPHVAVVDATVADGHAVVRDIRRSAPAVAIVALGIDEEEDEVVACAEAGIAGYVTREASVEELVAVVESAARGELRCSPRMAGGLLRRLNALADDRELPPASVRLTAREREIVRLFREDLSNKEIADRLGIEVATVKNHVHNLFEKLNVHRRSEAARLAAKLA